MLKGKLWTENNGQTYFEGELSMEDIIEMKEKGVELNINIDWKAAYAAGYEMGKKEVKK